MEYSLGKKEIRRLPIFFIVARERSGTTLLRTIFDAHPHVNIPVEFHFIWHLYHKYHKCQRWSEERLKLFYNDLVRLPRYKLLTADPKKLLNDLLALTGETNYASVCKVVLANYISFFPKKELLMVGDKCPLYSIHLAKLLKLFPDARIIHLTRDYRDNVMSMMRVRIESHVFSSLVYRWKFYNQKVSRIIQRHPSSICSIRYEDFVAGPERYLRMLSDFLGLPYVPETLEFYRKKDEFLKIYPEAVIERVHKSLFQPVNADHVYQWKKEMPSRLVRLADSIAGKEAEFWGYERQYKNRSIGLLLLHWPGLAYGRLYYTWGAIVGRLPVGLKSRLIFFLAWLFRRKWRDIQVTKLTND